MLRILPHPVLVLLLGLALVGCNGTFTQPGGSSSSEAEERIPVSDPAYCETVSPAPGAVRLRRLTNQEYENTIRDLLGQTGVTTGFPYDNESTDGFLNNTDALSLGDTRMEAYGEAAASLSSSALDEGSLARTSFLTCDINADSQGCARQFIGDFGLHAWRRPLEVEEVDRLYDLFALAQGEGMAPIASLEHVVRGMLLSPNFLFRTEGDSSVQTTRELDNYAIASRLSYFLWQSMPDDVLFDLAAAQQLQSDAELLAQVDRMLADSRAQAFYDAFADGWLHLSRLKDTAPDTGLFNFDESVREAMREETTRYIRRIVEGNKPLSELLTADFTIANDVLAAHYGLDVSGLDGYQEVPVDETRGGILTQASVLTLTSNPDRTSPVKRGEWVLNNILCAPPPPAPDNVEALPFEPGDGVSVRARLEQHRADPACAGCHSIMDPLGIALEHYDAVGQWREEDNGQPVDDFGELPTGETFEGAAGMAAVLATDPRFENCVTTKLLAYALGRASRPEDRCFREEIVERATVEDLTLRELVVQLVVNDVFRLGGEEVQ
ncbi:MAG: DUF1592 domain-containing protein [Myxococcota bacterium]